MTDFVEQTTALLAETHRLAGWEHSVLVLARPHAPELAVIHINERGVAWGGAVRNPSRVAHYEEMARTVTSDGEEDISSAVAEFEPESGGRVPMDVLMGVQAAKAGEASDATTSLLLVRDLEEGRAVSARWDGRRTFFVNEPLGHTDALIAAFDELATEPLLGAAGQKPRLRLAPPPPSSSAPGGPSAVMRYLRLEQPELVEWIEPFDDWLAAQPPAVQVGAWLWARLGAELDQAAEWVPGADEVLDLMADDQEDYIDAGERDPQSNPLPDICAAMLGGVWEDIGKAEPEPRLGELLNVAANAAIGINGMSRRWGLAYDMSVGQVAAAGWMGEYEMGPALIGLATLCPHIQRLWWIGECLARQGIVLSDSTVAPFPDDEMEAVRLLARMAANQPVLATAPQLQKQVPLRSDRWMSLTNRSHEVLDALALPHDPELSERLADEIRNRRHYLLDHVAVIELEELGISRLVLAPEEGADDQSMIAVNALVEHEQGTFVVSTSIRAGEGSHGIGPLRDFVGSKALPTVTTLAPAFLTERTQTEGSSPLELLVLSAWRDLVVPDVRDQQYVTVSERTRKGRRAERAGRARRVVHYVPRRLVVRRAEREARAASGEPTLRELYPVGAFAKRLPEGHSRSAEAALCGRDRNPARGASDCRSPALARRYRRGARPRCRVRGRARARLAKLERTRPPAHAPP